MRGFGLILLPLGTGGGGGPDPTPTAPWAYPGILGLEYEIEYNGITFNEHLKYGYEANPTAAERYKVTDIGGLDDADVRDSREVYAMRDGEFALPSFYAGRTITLTGYIQAKNLRRLREMANALRAAMSDISVERPLIFRAYPAEGEHTGDIYLMARKGAPLQLKDDFDPTVGRFRMSFMATFRASDPVFVSADPGAATASPGGAPLSITNQGTWYNWPTIQITGPVNDLIVYNTANGDQLALQSDVASGEVWTIDQQARTIKNASGTSQYSAINLLSTTWVRIVPGLNEVNLDGSGAGTVTLTWRHAWL